MLQTASLFVVHVYTYTCLPHNCTHSPSVPLLFLSPCLPLFIPPPSPLQWTIDEKKGGEREKKKVVKGGRGPVGKRMPAGRKMLAHRSMSESSHEEEEEEEDTVEDGARETQV